MAKAKTIEKKPVARKKRRDSNTYFCSCCENKKEE